MAVTNLKRKWLSLLALAPMLGCATFQDVHYEHSQKLRTECAYWKYRWSTGESVGSDYGKGWKAGYLDVLTGGDGQPPLVAPKCYWAPSQITKHCDEKRQEWYLGFQDGAMMASLEPDTHYIKTWTPPATVQPGYYEVQSEPPQVPASDPSEPLPLPEKNWEATPENDSLTPRPALPPAPANPETVN